MTPLLDGTKVLVVEDRLHIALALCDTLEENGCSIVGPAPRLQVAFRLSENEDIDIALLDVDLDGEQSYPVARFLRERHVPVVFLTGFDGLNIPADLRGLPLMEKPTRIPDLLNLIHTLVTVHASTGAPAANSEAT